MITGKPIKKEDKELWGLFQKKIENGDYLILHHAKKRQKDRNINDLVVLAILENKPGRKSKRNKSKDIYIPNHHDWNYCIEGSDIDGKKIRIIVSFDNTLMLVITVIRL